jgi:hypothetical protein
MEDAPSRVKRTRAIGAHLPGQASEDTENLQEWRSSDVVTQTRVEGAAKCGGSLVWRGAMSVSRDRALRGDTACAEPKLPRGLRRYSGR